MAAGYFEAVRFSEEDRQRAAYYEANARRVEVKERIGDMAAYLDSLDMTITFAPFDEIGRQRIAQLISKTNQFNLTTRRYSEAEVAAFERNPDYFTLQVRVADRFGDNGMISVVICQKQRELWSIDTWLMSCRVLGRRVEEAVFQEIVRCAREAGATALVGTYLPSERNGLVRQHYERLGFELVEQRPDGCQVFRTPIANTRPTVLPFAVARNAV
jgi:FkbH-like protein